MLLHGTSASFVISVETYTIPLRKRRKQFGWPCPYSSCSITLSIWSFSLLHLIIMSLWHHPFDPSRSCFMFRKFIFDYIACHPTPLSPGHLPHSIITNTCRIWIPTSVPCSGNINTHSFNFLAHSDHSSRFQSVTCDISTLPPVAPIIRSCADLDCGNDDSVCQSDVPRSFPASIWPFYQIFVIFEPLLMNSHDCARMIAFWSFSTSPCASVSFRVYMCHRWTNGRQTSARPFTFGKLMILMYHHRYLQKSYHHRSDFCVIFTPLYLSNLRPLPWSQFSSKFYRNWYHIVVFDWFTRVLHQCIDGASRYYNVRSPTRLHRPLLCQYELFRNSTPPSPTSDVQHNRWVSHFRTHAPATRWHIGFIVVIVFDNFVVLVLIEFYRQFWTHRAPIPLSWFYPTLWTPMVEYAYQ